MHFLLVFLHIVDKSHVVNSPPERKQEFCLLQSSRPLSEICFCGLTANLSYSFWNAHQRFRPQGFYFAKTYNFKSTVYNPMDFYNFQLLKNCAPTLLGCSLRNTHVAENDNVFRKKIKENKNSLFLFIFCPLIFSAKRNFSIWFFPCHDDRMCQWPGSFSSEHLRSTFHLKRAPSRYGVTKKNKWAHHRRQRDPWKR